MEHALLREKPARIVELLATVLEGVDETTLGELDAMAAHDARAINRLPRAAPDRPKSKAGRA